MGLIHDNQVIIADCGHGFPIVVEDALYHPLYSRHMDTGFPLDLLVLQAFDIVDICQRHQLFQLDLFEYIQGLFSQLSAVYQKQDAFETTRFQKPVDHTQHGTRLAGTSRHGQQNACFSIYNSLLRCLNRTKLIISKIQSVFIPQQVKGHLFQCPIACICVFIQQLQKIVRAHPALQWLRHIGSLTEIQKPNA